VIHTFTVSNSGLVDLATSKLKLPKGYVLVEGLSPTIAAGGSDTFEVQLVTNQPGVKGGMLTFKTNQHGAAEFSFKLVGTVTAASSSSLSAADFGAPDDAMRLVSGNDDPLLDIQHHNANHGAGFGHWHDFDLI